jgi:hypothetical protein
MNDELIIEMAKEAKLPHYWETGDIVFLDAVKRFAELVAQHEREFCAKVFAKVAAHLAIEEIKHD